ncbi:tyrosine-type recombinase/integrase [Legionella brunensis]|uniref:Phage related integrase n=1 Tax=Legionella brunensis TaxID=29422 RepID=A0A0W0SFR4_9GAMM|nr:tyrosine-type recombinase/integrase [Legionella brunensis]KTC81717.1 phage related integrase [Legionella brunensis]
MRIKKSTVDNLPLPLATQEGKTAQKRYYDDNLKGFGVRITSGGTKAFFVEKLINKKLCRITLGRYPELTAEMARNKALEMLGQIAMGIDPVAEKRANQMRQVTLNDVFKDYLQTRKSLKASTITNYKQILTKAFSSWTNKPLISITKDKIAKHHEKLGEAHGEAYANLAMRVLRALFNFAAGQYEDSQGRSLITENPVKRLSQTRAWYRVERRQTFIKSHELAPWYKGLEQLSNQTLKDYLLLVLFTGLRRQEAATLTWNQVDLTAKTLTIIETKNNESHTLPLSDFIYDLLMHRKANRSNDYVFPGAGAAGHIVEPRKQMAKVTMLSDIQFTVHDLRRTFITIAESLDIPAYALKRLLNHKMANDVTAGYIVADVERLRKPILLITDYILKCMGVIKSAEVIAIQQDNKELLK